MPTERIMTVAELDGPVERGWKQRLMISEEELYKRMLMNEEVLTVEESSFSDPGPDYCRLKLNGQVIADWPGY